MCLRRLLVEEVPAYAEAEDSFVERIVRREEVVAVALSGVHVTHHYEEACVLEVEVGVDVHYGVVAHFRAAVAFLHAELSQCRAVVWRVILGEVSGVSTEIALQNLCYAELQIQVGVYVEVGHGQSVVI